MDNQQVPPQNPSVDPAQNQQSKPSYNPLMDNVSEKPYSVSSVNVSQEQVSQSIPEPTYQPQNLGSRENPYRMIKDGGNPSMGSSSNSSAETPPPINPTLNNIPESDRKEGAKYVAKVIMDVYKQAHVWINATLPFNEKKLQRLEAEGQIDLNMVIPDGQGNTITPAMYVQEFNEQVKDALQVDPKWEKETMPILEKVLAKRGAAMTDEQMLLFMFGKDIGVKGFQFVGLKKQQSEMIQLLIDLKNQGSAVSNPAPHRSKKTDAKTENDKTTSPYAYAPQNTPPPPPARNVKADSERFNFENNEAVMQSTVEQMNVPSSGKQRLMQQRAKEKKWKQDEENASKGVSSYDEAMAQRKTGKRGRKKSVVDYVKAVDKEEIVDALILSETKNKE